MREQRVRQRLAVGQIERGGELMAAFAGELETFGGHGYLHSYPPAEVKRQSPE